MSGSANVTGVLMGLMAFDGAWSSMWREFEEPCAQTSRWSQGARCFTNCKVVFWLVLLLL